MPKPEPRPDPRPEPRCPVCRKPANPKHAPFCSEGCRNRDLIAWLDERYVVPGRPIGEDDEPG